MTQPDRRYRVEVQAEAAKQLRKLDPPVRRRVLTVLNKLAANPRPHGCVQLTGYPGLWRVRSGDYRIVYTVEDDALLVAVVRVAHRGEVYRQM